MDKIKQLQEECKCWISIEINEHRNNYETVEQYFEDHWKKQHKEEIPKYVYDEMVRTNTIVSIQYYPNTPIGFNVVYHYDLEMALDGILTK
jgi:uncharacterized membrane protein